MDASQQFALEGGDDGVWSVRGWPIASVCPPVWSPTWTGQLYAVQGHTLVRLDWRSGTPLTNIVIPLDQLLLPGWETINALAVAPDTVVLWFDRYVGVALEGETAFASLLDTQAHLGDDRVTAASVDPSGRYVTLTTTARPYVWDTHTQIVQEQQDETPSPH